MNLKQITLRILYCLIIFQIVACSSPSTSVTLNNSDVLIKDSFDSKGTRINYVSKGKGEPIIFIHGFLANSNWNWIEAGTFDSLAKNYRVIAMDVRGHGTSEKPHSKEAYGKEILEDINRLMKHLNIDRANIVGYSMGGEITLAYLTSYPEKVIKAVAGGCGWMKTGDEKYEQWKKNRDLLATIPAGVSIVERLWPGSDSTSDISKIVNANDPLALSGVANGMLQLSIEENKLLTNKVPTLLLIGEEDRLMKSAETTASVATNMKLQILKGQDHLSAINDPLFLTTIENFLKEK
ncbi:MAG: alpha/beta hydrolase [Flavobacterium sp.]|nr:MAG: alpha/beta hydrolase [Flavobacterium sp.]